MRARRSVGGQQTSHKQLPAAGDRVCSCSVPTVWSAAVCGVTESVAVEEFLRRLVGDRRAMDSGTALFGL